MTDFSCCNPYNFYPFYSTFNEKINTSSQNSISTNITENAKSHRGTITERSGWHPVNMNCFSTWTPTFLPFNYICPCNFHHQHFCKNNPVKKTIYTQTEISFLTPKSDLFKLNETKTNKKSFHVTQQHLNAPQDSQYLAEKIKLTLQEIEALKNKKANKDISSESESEIEETYVFGISDSPSLRSLTEINENKSNFSIYHSPDKIEAKRQLTKDVPTANFNF